MGLEEGTLTVRGRLLEAAGGFASLGYVDLSVAQILAKAGVQAPTLYHYFGDKEGLFSGWAVAALEELGIAIRMGAEGKSFERALAAIADAVRNPRFPDLIQLTRDLAKLEQTANREAIVEALQRTTYEPVYARLIEAMQLGQLRTEPLHATAAVFLTGACALRNGGVLAGASETGSEWWVQRFLAGFGV